MDASEQLRQLGDDIARKCSLAKTQADQLLETCTREKQAWEKEKKMIAATYQRCEVARMCVGGTMFATNVTTFEADHAKNTMLACLFSGRHELKQDESGAVFIDRDPGVFRYILQYLRSPSTFVPPRDAGEQEQLVQDATYYNMPKEFFGEVTDSDFRPFSWCSKLVDDSGAPAQSQIRQLLMATKPKLEVSKILSACSNNQTDAFSKMFASAPKLRLLLDSSVDGSSTDVFHNKVNNQGPTLTVIKEAGTNMVFGVFLQDNIGYSDWIPGHPSNFLFTLGNGTHPPTKLLKPMGNGLHSNNCGLHAGQGGDLVVFCSSADSTGFSRFTTPAPGFENVPANANTLRGRSGTFNSELKEVFAVTF